MALIETLQHAARAAALVLSVLALLNNYSAYMLAVYCYMFEYGSRLFQRLGVSPAPLHVLVFLNGLLVELEARLFHLPAHTKRG